MSDSDENYEVPSGGNDEIAKQEVSVIEIRTEPEKLDTVSKKAEEKPETDEKLAQQMKLLAVIDQKTEAKEPAKAKDKGSTSIIGNLVIW